MHTGDLSAHADQWVPVRGDAQGHGEGSPSLAPGGSPSGGQTCGCGCASGDTAESAHHVGAFTVRWVPDSQQDSGRGVCWSGYCPWVGVRGQVRVGAQGETQTAFGTAAGPWMGAQTGGFRKTPLQDRRPAGTARPPGDLLPWWGPESGLHRRLWRHSDVTRTHLAPRPPTLPAPWHKPLAASPPGRGGRARGALSQGGKPGVGTAGADEGTGPRRAPGPAARPPARPPTTRESLSYKTVYWGAGRGVSRE